MAKTGKDSQSLKDLAEALALKATNRNTEKHRREFHRAEEIKKKLELRLTRARQRYKELKEKIDVLRKDDRAARKQTMSSINKLDKTMSATRARARQIELELREARALVKESRLLLRAAESKQRALAQALMAFIKTWEKKYTKKYAVEIQNTKVRRRWLQKN